MRIIAIGGFFHDLNFSYYDTEIGLESLICVEEERFSREKQHKIQSKSVSSLYGIDFILKSKELKEADVDLILFSDIVDQPIYSFIIGRFINSKSLKIGHHLCHFGNILSFNKKLLENSASFIYDAYGDNYSGMNLRFRNNEIHNINYHEMCDSLGIVYTAATTHLGLGSFGSEGKMQGLASYGSYKESLSISKYIHIKDNLICLNKELNLSSLSPDQELYSSNKNMEIELFYNLISKRFIGEELTQKHCDFAYTVQNDLFNYILKHIEENIVNNTPSIIGIGGGIAQNSSLIGYLNAKLKPIKCVTSTSCSDRGNSLGAIAYYCLKELNNNSYNHFFPVNPFLGYREESNLKNDNNFELVSENSIQKSCEILMRGEILASFSGKAEYGSRALGNRSILASPSKVNMRDFLNADIKHREKFRPFAPIILEETFQNHFSKEYSEVCFMTECIKCSSEFQKNSPAAVHVDGTCRVQIAKKNKVNDYILEILTYLKQKHNLLAIINTSLNNAGEPIVNNIKDLKNTMIACNIKYVITDDGLFKIKNS